MATHHHHHHERDTSASHRRSSQCLLLASVAAVLLLCALPTVRAEADNDGAAAPGGAGGAWGLRWLLLPLLRGGALPAGLTGSTAAALGPVGSGGGGGGGSMRLARRLLSPWVARGVSRPICNSPAVLCSSAWSLDGNWVKASYKIAENEPKAGAAGGGGVGRGAFLGAAVSRG